MNNNLKLSLIVIVLVVSFLSIELYLNSGKERHDYVTCLIEDLCGNTLKYSHIKGDHVGEYVCSNNAFEDLKEWVIDGGRELIDLGCNTGFYSMVASCKLNKVICVEMQQDLVDLITFNLKQNQISNVKVIPNGISFRRRTLFHPKPGDNHGGVGLHDNRQEGFIGLTTKQFSHIDLSGVTHMKMDIEGLESEVLNIQTLPWIANLKFIHVELRKKQLHSLHLLDDLFVCSTILCKGCESKTYKNYSESVSHIMRFEGTGDCYCNFVCIRK